jgi:uncharacterized protein (DUF1501 family)
MNVYSSTHRRTFLARGLGLVAVGGALPRYLVRTALAGPETKDGRQRVLVVVQLSGGHDALSALVPHGDPEYHKLRQATRVAENEVIKVDDYHGLHPNLAGFRQLLDEGAFAAIPGVGYPDPNYSHFTSTDIWHTASQDADREPHGWIGRALDCAYPDDTDPLLSMAVGTGKSPRVMASDDHPGIAFSRPEAYRYAADRGDQTRRKIYESLNATASAAEPNNLDFIAATAIRANESSEKVRQLAAAYKPKAEYPTTNLGRSLQVIAGLIVGGLSTRIFFTETGGFDTHQGQRLRHDRLMADLNGALSAFQNDLTQQGQADRVLTMTTSEFGRRVKENGSQGTDHGAASAQFFLGPGLKPGIHGQPPSLTDLQGGGGGSLKHTSDFRSVYATVLEKWLDIPSEPVLREEFPLLDFLA